MSIPTGKCAVFVGVGVHHVIWLQKSNLMLVKKQAGIGFCPEEAGTDTAFVEFSELTADHVVCM